MWLTILYILIFLYALYGVFFVVQFYNIVFKNNAPLISTNKKVLRKIINEIELKDGVIVYELGCGKANFLKELKKRNDKVKCVGVENMFIASLVLRLELFLRKSDIKVIKDNIFNIDLSEADIVYCFLNNGTMEKLGEKFKKECKKGTMVISNKFQINNFDPIKVSGEKDFKIYYYEF